MLKDYNEIIHIRRTPSVDVTSESIVWITDVFSLGELSNMLRSRRPAYVVNDHFTSVDLDNYKVYCAPLWLAHNTRLIIQNLPKQQTYKTQNIFNFMINKKKVNRFLCMKLVELFELTNYDYTWSGVDSKFDMSDIIDELIYLGNKSPLSPEQRSFLLSDIKIPPKFFRHTGLNNKSNIAYPNNSWTWNHGLNKVFSSSAVSLITESLSFEKGSVFTEKTAYALLGKTFPIWVGGGMRQAQQFEKMGFDVFSDVIDHSYQYYNTLIERCYYAIEKNLHILTDYEYASKIRELMMNRLEQNQHLLKNKQVDNFCKQQIKQWPLDLQQAIGNELKIWFEG